MPSCSFMTLIDSQIESQSKQRIEVGCYLGVKNKMTSGMGNGEVCGMTASFAENEYRKVHKLQVNYPSWKRVFMLANEKRLYV